MRSSQKIWSMIPANGSSFGRAAGCVTAQRGSDLPRSYLEERMMRRVISIAAVCAALVVFDANAWWEVRSSTPTAAQTAVGFEGQALVGLLLVNFMPKLDCKPEVSVLMMDGNRLGTAEKQAWVKSKMTIWVDGKKVWNGRTAITKYSNGVESGGAATPKLIEALKTGKEATVQPLESQPKLTFGLENSDAAIKEARGNCR